jgi:hypothetical protein
LGSATEPWRGRRASLPTVALATSSGTTPDSVEHGLAPSPRGMRLCLPGKCNMAFPSVEAGPNLEDLNHAPPIGRVHRRLVPVHLGGAPGQLAAGHRTQTASLRPRCGRPLWVSGLVRGANGCLGWNQGRGESVAGLSESWAGGVRSHNEVEGVAPGWSPVS